MRALLVPVTGLLLGAALAAVSDLLPSFIVDNFEELIKAAAATCEVLPLDIIFSRQSTPELRHLELVQFTRGRGQRRYRARDAPRLLASQRRVPPSPLLLYVPGWWNTPSDESSTALVQALLHRHPSVLLLDTRLSFCRGYVGSASRVNSLANLLYRLIYKLVSRGVPLESIHLVGFSLGAHVVGMTGRLVQRNMNRKLERITALDPAKPCFARSSKFRLSRRDAEFVQVIHTSTGVLGLEQPVGHADVYMNGVPGRQPECRDSRISLECDHAQAWKLYAASVMNASSLRGRRCRSWDELLSGSCAGDEAVLGWGCSRDTRGMFLHTSEAARRTSPLRYKELQVFNPFDPFSWFSK